MDNLENWLSRQSDEQIKWLANILTIPEEFLPLKTCELIKAVQNEDYRRAKKEHQNGQRAGF
jgi:hypothetical protein